MREGLQGAIYFLGLTLMSKTIGTALCSLQGATDIHFLFVVYANPWAGMEILT